MVSFSYQSPCVLFTGSFFHQNITFKPDNFLKLHRNKSYGAARDVFESLPEDERKEVWKNMMLKNILQNRNDGKVKLEKIETVLDIEWYYYDCFKDYYSFLPDIAIYLIEESMKHEKTRASNQNKYSTMLLNYVKRFSSEEKKKIDIAMVDYIVNQQ